MPKPYEAFEQREKLTTRLHNILREYAEGSSMLSEFVQNADDAKARSFKVILDLREGRGLPEAPGSNVGSDMRALLEASRGPALLVFNDATFTDGDFASIASVGASGKAGDSSRIGKYGLGFN
jgi:sacsin